MLSIEESDNDVQNNGQQNRKHTRSDNGKVKQATASLDADIPRQSPKRNPQSRSQIYSPTNQDHDDPANYQETNDIFHILYFQVERVDVQALNITRAFVVPPRDNQVSNAHTRIWLLCVPARFGRGSQAGADRVRRHP